jgi:hypothetical protein
MDADLFQSAESHRGLDPLLDCLLSMEGDHVKRHLVRLNDEQVQVQGGTSLPSSTWAEEDYLCTGRGGCQAASRLFDHGLIGHRHLKDGRRDKRRSGARLLPGSALAEHAGDLGNDFTFDTPAVVRLTEYAVPLRYDELLDATPLDRDAAVKLVSEVGGWANHLLDAFSE